jgi:predicted esterase
VADEFTILQGAALRLMDQGQNAQAYAKLTELASQYPDRATLYYLRSCLAARLADTALALSLIREALDKDFFFGEMLMRQSPSWKGLQGLAEFEELAAISVARQRELAAPAHYLTALPHDRSAPHPAVLALHGNGGNAQEALAAWHPVVEQGRLLASIQSSQPFATDQYAWDDLDLALKDIGALFTALTAEHQIDARHTIIAGFSMGAETALQVAINGTVPVCGFLMLNPGGPGSPDPDALLPLIRRQRATGVDLRGYLLVGALDDEVPAETHRRLTELLADHGVPCGFEILPGIGHDYPDDFGPIIQRALAFVDPQG